MRLPENVYQTLVSICDAYPWPVVQRERDLGDILNRVAWLHRSDGWGLSRKVAGQHVDSPVGPIAEDILQLKNGHHFDVLGGAGVGQPLRPGRPNSIGIIDLNARPWVAPVDHVPAWLVDGPAPPPAPDPDPEPDIPVACDCQCNVTEQDVAGLTEAVFKLAADIQAMRQEQARAGRLEELVQELVRHLDDTKARVERVSQELANKPVGKCKIPW